MRYRETDTLMPCLLLDYGADANIPDRSNRTPLYAAYDGLHVEVMRLLLEHGAVPDVQWDSDIGLLIHEASQAGHTEVVRLLLQHNADNRCHWSFKLYAIALGITRRTRGCCADPPATRGQYQRHGTSLLCASFWGNFDVVRLLLEHGADVRLFNPGSGIPFQTAALRGHT
jgi:ankyrin repeat protein